MAGGVAGYSTWLLDAECPFAFSTHERTGQRPAFVCLDVGGRYQPCRYSMHLPTVAVIDRLVATLTEARAWLAAQETRDRDDHSNRDAAAAAAEDSPAAAGAGAGRRVELAPAAG